MVRRVLLIPLVVVVALPACKHTPSPEAGAEASLLWVEPAGRSPDGSPTIDVHYAERGATTASAVFDCEVRSDKDVGKSVLRSTVLDETGAIRYEAELRLEVLAGVYPCRFEWDPSGVEDGTYTVRFELLRRPLRTLAFHEIAARKVTESQAAATIEQVARESEDLEKLVARLEQDGSCSAYARMRVAVIRDYLPAAQEAVENEDWVQAQALGRYLAKTVHGVRCGLVFGEITPELSRPMPEPDMSRVEVRDGAFYVGSRPVFLCGGAGGDRLAGKFPTLHRYGLNAAMVTVSPAQIVPGETKQADMAGLLGETFGSARDNNIGLTVLIDVHDPVPWALEKWPEMTDGHPYDVTTEAAYNLVDRYLAAAIPYVAGQDMAVSVCLADRPEFRFGSAAFRQGFIDYLRTRYKDRDELNAVWRTHLNGFDDVTVDWDSVRGAYRRDLCAFQQQATTAFFAHAVATTRTLAADLPVQVRLANRALEPSESVSGINRRALAHLFDVGGCASANHVRDHYSSLGYPEQVLFYTLLRSIAPDKPVFNTLDDLLPGNGSDGTEFGRVHAAMWEAAIAGLSGSLAPMGSGGAAGDARDDLLSRPERIEAYATACLDLNRLADVVVAFQRAPAPVAVLWSESSKGYDGRGLHLDPATTAYEGGRPYIHSMARAFDGVSGFGHNVRFITERQCEQGLLDGAKVLVIPKTLAVTDGAFAAIEQYITSGGVVIRGGTPMPYDPWGQSRHDVLSHTVRTFLVQGDESAQAYRHALDSAYTLGTLAPIPRAINSNGYPIEGVRTRFVEFEGTPYLYLVNVRDVPVNVHLFGELQTGRDLIHGCDVAFPMAVTPLDPMLVRLDAPSGEPGDEDDSTGTAKEDIPSAILEPVS